MLKQIVRKNKQELRVNSYLETCDICQHDAITAQYKKDKIKIRIRFRGSRHDKNKLTCLKKDATRFDVYLRD
jgi:hypothetical protein